MNLTKILLVPLVAMVAMAFFAAPAIGQASYHFLDDTEPIGEGTTEPVAFIGPMALRRLQ
jgi:hypothetical protein